MKNEENRIADYFFYLTFDFFMLLYNQNFGSELSKALNIIGAIYASLHNQKVSPTWVGESVADVQSVCLKVTEVIVML